MEKTTYKIKGVELDMQEMAAISQFYQLASVAETLVTDYCFDDEQEAWHVAEQIMSENEEYFNQLLSDTVAEWFDYAEAETVEEDEEDLETEDVVWHADELNNKGGCQNEGSAVQRLL